MYFVYVLRCAGNTLYTGITTDLARRLAQHCGACPGGAKYTRAHPPAGLEVAWEAPDRAAASRLECRIKQLTREEKERLLAETAPEKPEIRNCRRLPPEELPSHGRAAEEKK